MLQPSRQHFRCLSQKFAIKAKCFSWQNLLKYHSFYSLQNKAISKARLPFTIDLGSTTGTCLSMYHRKPTRVTHCPHLQELERLYPEQFFTRIRASKISCRDFHCIFRTHWRATQELTLQEVWGLCHCHLITLLYQQPFAQAEHSSRGKCIHWSAVWALRATEQTHNTAHIWKFVHQGRKSHLKKYCLVFFSIWISVFTLSPIINLIRMN